MSEALKPFGIEFLEEITNPPQIALGEQHGGAVCCETFMSDITGNGDVGSYTCVNGVDNPCCDYTPYPCS
jgi:hypothetical protein